jgi:glycosyltransferase involved in cell wall biosynthesis
MAWLATAWDEDRRERVRSFPIHRRLLDRLVVRPVTARLERRILRAGRIFAISGHTAGSLGRTAGMPPTPVIPVPVDAGALTPRPGAAVAGRVGFAGRLEDPRKNVELLLDAIACARGAGTAVTGVLMGARDPEAWRRRAAARGLEGCVEVLPHRERFAEVVETLRSLDLFVIPSHQEGLCIAALEAMACGCPVVSTRCGGPADFVVEGVTGFWADSTPEGMAAAIARVVRDRGLRERLSGAARSLVERNFSPAAAERAFAAGLRESFPALGA